MKIILAIFVPPLAVLLCGKPILAIVLLILQITMIGWIPATIIAVYVVLNHDADKRIEGLAKAMGAANAQQQRR